MSITTKVRESDNVALIDIAGRLALGSNEASVQEVVRGLIDSGKKQIVLNLAGVTYVDSSGLRQLVAIYATAANHGGEIKLLKLNKRVYDLMQITKLYTVFEIHTTEETAVQGFRVPAAAR
jgi:anti-sigma B factor antagonist